MLLWRNNVSVTLSNDCRSCKTCIPFLWEGGQACVYLRSEGNWAFFPLPQLNQTWWESATHLPPEDESVLYFLAGSSQPSGTKGGEAASRISRWVCWLMLSSLLPNFPWPDLVCEHKGIVWCYKELEQEHIQSKYVLGTRGNTPLTFHVTAGISSSSTPATLSIHILFLLWSCTKCSRTVI